MRLFFVVSVTIALLGWLIPDRPDHLKINGERWEVLWPEKIAFKVKVPNFILGTIEEKEIEYSGFTLCEKKTILISRARDEDGEDQHDSYPETLMHEVAHAQTCADGEAHNNAYNSPITGAHPGIEFLAQHFTDFIQQNPKAVAWIIWMR